jgi:probable rRNA maturation factor
MTAGTSTGRRHTSLNVDVTVAGARVGITRAGVIDAARAALRADGVRDALLSIAFVGRRAIARINAEHLHHAGATDVISFGFSRVADDDPVVGDIYICPDVARANARARGIGVREEVTRLVVHGVLHVLGHDHPADAGREQSDMWRRQERIVRRLFASARHGRR